MRRALLTAIALLAVSGLACASRQTNREPPPSGVEPTVTQATPLPSTAEQNAPTTSNDAPVPLPTTPLLPKRVAVSDAEVLRGPTNTPSLSLVINVGAGFTPAEEVLDVLASRGVHTTFFVMGWWAERNPELLRRIHAAGHEIASHGHSVFDLTLVSDAEVIADLERADAVISAITGQSTRPLWSPSAGNRDARVRRIASALGYRPILWSQDSGDWCLDATADEVRRRVLAGAEPGAIIVLHFDSSRSVSATLPVLGEVIDTLRARGLELVTITELIGE